MIIELDTVFHALADPTRRGMLARLSLGETSVGALAEPFSMSLAGASKHVKVLEHAGLVARRKIGRTHLCSLNAGPLAEATDWLRQWEKYWAVRLDRLEAAIQHDKQDKEKTMVEAAWKQRADRADRAGHDPTRADARRADRKGVALPDRGRASPQWFMGGTDARANSEFELLIDHDKLSDDDVSSPENYAKMKGTAWHEKVIRFEPPHLLATTFQGGKNGTVTYALFPDGERTRLVLTHSGIQSGSRSRGFRQRLEFAPDRARGTAGGAWGQGLLGTSRPLARGRGEGARLRVFATGQAWDGLLKVIARIEVCDRPIVQG